MCKCFELCCFHRKRPIECQHRDRTNGSNSIEDRSPQTATYQVPLLHPNTPSRRFDMNLRNSDGRDTALAATRWLQSSAVFEVFATTPRGAPSSIKVINNRQNGESSARHALVVRGTWDGIEEEGYRDVSGMDEKQESPINRLARRWGRRGQSGMSWTAMQGESRPTEIRMVTSGGQEKDYTDQRRTRRWHGLSSHLEDQRSPCTCARSSADTHVAFPKDLQNQAEVGQEVEAEPTCSPVVQVED